MLLVCFFITMPGGIDRLLSEISSNMRISVHNKGGRRLRHAVRVRARSPRALPGVTAVNGEVWFGGAFEEESKVTFPNFAVEPDAVGAVWPDYKIDPIALEEFRR